MKIAYITSSSFSGSTLLSFLLNSHPDIGTISEFDVIDNVDSKIEYKCSCGARFLECKFFKELESRMIAEGLDFSLGNMNLMFDICTNERLNRYLVQKLPLIQSTKLEHIRDSIINRIPSHRVFLEKQLQRNRVFMKHVMEIQGASLFLDANKNPYRMKVLSREHEIIPIYIYKNGISGAYSIYSRGRHSKRSMSFKQACIKWFVEQITIMRVLRELQSPNEIMINYSRLCEETQNTISSIYRALGINVHSIDEFNKTEHHILGNVMRTKGLGEIKETTKWKENLNEFDLDTYRTTYNKYCPILKELNNEMAKNLWY